MGRPPSTPVLTLLASIVEERTGIHYDGQELDMLAVKAEAHAADAGFESLLDYYYFLRYDAGGAEELEALAERLVVNESYFFRELPPLELLVDRLVAPRVARGERVRLWSAACAAGEEPLTLAMLLDDRGLLSSVELVASDLSRRALARAASGRYSPRALRDGHPPALAARYLRTEPDGTLAVPRRLVEAISWRRLNLVDPAHVAPLGRFDVVLLRNVLIYFSDETVARVVASITGALVPGGTLFVGIAESLLRFGTSVTCEEHEDVFLYRRP